ncbi:hypothetical protein [Actinoplanes regularis]|uniref:hypothetical protein n=1 Tax=Actinoplanes regularis TaxID=52697 RepID=UPI0024A0ED7C|nr:hypothetical protein [Actinoplanes regularis]GLW35835.1 hypothetical protein Areg01_87700 [Actinoplanes regularis]
MFDHFTTTPPRRRGLGIAFAAGSLLLGSGAAAQAAPAGVTVSVNRLILEPGTFGHVGSVRIVIKNRTGEPYDGGITVTEPIARTFGEALGTGTCGPTGRDGERDIIGCSLEDPIQPGANATVTISFRSPAKPQAFARVAPTVGTVEVQGGATASFQAIFRAATGGLTHPRPYVQDTEAELNVSVADVTLNRQDDGTYLGGTSVVVRNDGDAPHFTLGTELAIPAGVDEWPTMSPGGVCGVGGSLPTPPGGFQLVCSIEGGRLDEGRTRSWGWVFTAPAGTAPGLLGTATTQVALSDGPGQSDGANRVAFTITVAD